ncbi:MAG: YggT family protein [Spirochaetales bacterium]|nr:YggT family protein [Spirochaetales bacterium]
MIYFIMLKTFSICINIYLFLLFIRILCSWFKPQVDGKLWNYLCLITGPYLALFKGIKFLRRGIFDFTPVLAISLLAFINQSITGITFFLEQTNQLTFGIFLAIFISSIWNIISYIIIFFGILCIIRLISIVFHMNQDNNILKIIDLAIQPVISLVMKIITRKLDYIKLLFLTFLLLAAFFLLGSLLFGYLVELVIGIPV